MKCITIFNIFLIIIFSMAIGLPALKADFVGGNVSSTENRYLAKFPELFDENKNFRSTDLKNELEAWISDNAFGRELFYNINTKLNLKMFNLHNTNEIIYGYDHWIYLMAGNNIKRIQNADCPQGNDRILLENRIKKVSSIIHEKTGCYFQINVFPCKSDIYPENLPPLFNEIQLESSLDMYADFSKREVADINVLYDSMMKYKENSALLYFKAYDSNHWNNLGAYYGYLEIMNQIKEKIPTIKILTIDDFIINEQVLETNIAGIRYAYETNFCFELKKQTAHENKEHLNKIGFLSSDSWNSSNYYKNENRNLPKAIIIGDSYTWMFMIPNLAESFSELYFIHAGGDKNNLNNILNFVSPDIILVNGLSETITDFFMNFDTEKVDLSIPSTIIEPEGLPYAFLDYVNDEAIQNNNPDIFVELNNDCISLHGWSLDINKNQLNSRVIVEIGDELYCGNYGNDRQNVSDFFSNQQLLKSGFDVSIDIKKVLRAGGFKLHFISNDGTYEYPPLIFNVYPKSK